MVKVVCASIKSGPMYGHKFFVKTNAPVLIGRDANANIRITNDEFCSRKHAILNVGEQRMLYTRHGEC